MAQSQPTREPPAGVRPPSAPFVPRLGLRCAAEAAGTFVIVFLGVGVVHAAVLAKAHSGLLQVALVWGIGVAAAIHATAALSGAHLNPAMTAAFAVFGSFPRREVLAYWLSQVTGAFLAAAIIHPMFAGFLREAELAAGVVRGSPGSEVTAMCYGEYFPNPGLGTDERSLARVPELTAWVAEFAATAVLAFVIFALSEPRNSRSPGSAMTPALIGLTVAGLISVIGPLTQACLNPARDFGPRLFAWLAGWGSIAIPGPRGGFFTVYILAPIAGALAGAGLFAALARAGYRRDEEGNPSP